MRVIQIGKALIRRAFRSELRWLEEGEMALAVDTGEVFIGSKTLPSEIKDTNIFQWLPNVYYIAGNRVSYAGKIYVATQSHTSQSSFNSGYWEEYQQTQNNLNLPILTTHSRNVENHLRYTFLGRNTFIDVSAGANAPIQNIADFNENIPDIWTTQKFKVNATTYATQGVRRFLQEKLDDTISVKDYGSTGNAYSNIVESPSIIQQYNMEAETLAINKALLSSNRENTKNRKVHFPAGVYVINNPLFIPKNTKMIGDGIDKTRIIFNISGQVFDKFNPHFLTTIGVNFADEEININELQNYDEYSNYTYNNIKDTVENIHIEGISFEVFGTQSPAAPQKFDGFALIKARNVTVKNCRLKGKVDRTATTPVALPGAWPSVSEALCFDSSGFSSIAECKNINIENCILENWDAVSIMSDAMSSITFENNMISKCGGGIYVGEAMTSLPTWRTEPNDYDFKNGPQNILIKGNTFEHLNHTAIEVSKGYKGTGIASDPVTFEEYLASVKLGSTTPYQRVSHVHSEGNFFHNCGNYSNLPLSVNNPIENSTAPVIHFKLGTQYCSSIMDKFTRNADYEETQAPQKSRVYYLPTDPHIVINTQDVPFFPTSSSRAGERGLIPNAAYSQPSSGGRIILGNITDGSDRYTYFIDYTLKTNNTGSTSQRSGIMTVSVDPTDTSNILFNDDFSAIGIDVTTFLPVVDASGFIEILYRMIDGTNTYTGDLFYEIRSGKSR